MINIPDTDLKKGEYVGVVKKDNLLGFAPTVTNTFEEDNWTSKEVYMGTIITQNGKTLGVIMVQVIRKGMRITQRL